jgi:pyrroline-5-carboxylate reductase
LARWLGTEHIVRAMPNTPALVGKGVSGLVALPSVTADERIAAERILEAVGRAVWVEHEQQLDAVTALSGSGPAYVFYFIEALLDAGRELGLSAEQTRALVIETFIGASALAATRPEPVATLRAQVTSQGGTTAAALTRLEQSEVKKNIVAAIHAACIRAQELGDEFGR